MYEQYSHHGCSRTQFTREFPDRKVIPDTLDRACCDNGEHAGTQEDVKRRGLSIASLTLALALNPPYASLRIYL
jgi:hypothetical protein